MAIIKAQEDAERDATRIKVAAEADKIAADDRATALRVEAKADADAMIIRAAAKKADALAEAEGKQAIVEAENAIQDRVVAMKIDLAKIRALPEIVAHMVKPVEKIDSIRVNYIGGLGANGGAAPGTVSSSGDKPIVNQIMDGVLGMALQMPAVQQIGKDLGIDLQSGLAGVTQSLEKVSEAPKDKPAKDMHKKAHMHNKAQRPQAPKGA